jgi:putative resolvase
VRTAYRWDREGSLPVPARKAGRLILVPPAVRPPGPLLQGGLDARVSCHDQKAGLDRQVALLPAWPGQAGLPVVRVEAGAGSGMNGTRGRARRLLADPAASVVVVEHRGRPGRVTTGLAGAALAAHGRRLVVVDHNGVTGDLVRDITGVLRSLCARRYGRRPARNRVLTAVGCARWGIGPRAVLTAGSISCGGAG